MLALAVAVIGTSAVGVEIFLPRKLRADKEMKYSVSHVRGISESFGEHSLYRTCIPILSKWVPSCLYGHH